MVIYLLREEIDIPKDVEVNIKNEGFKRKIIIKRKDKEIEREIFNNRVNVKIENNKIILECFKATKKDKKDLYTIYSHIKNAIDGITNGFKYKLRYVYVHFPMKVYIKNNVIHVENFLGGKDVLKLEVPKDIKVTISGQDIILEGHDIEKLGNFATKLEQLTRVREKDLRKFQDGIYIIEKP